MNRGEMVQVLMIPSIINTVTPVTPLTHIPNAHNSGPYAGFPGGGGSCKFGKKVDFLLQYPMELLAERWGRGRFRPPRPPLRPPPPEACPLPVQGGTTCSVAQFALSPSHPSRWSCILYYYNRTIMGQLDRDLRAWGQTP